MLPKARAQTESNSAPKFHFNVADLTATALQSCLGSSSPETPNPLETPGQELSQIPSPAAASLPAEAAVKLPNAEPHSVTAVVLPLGTLPLELVDPVRPEKESGTGTQTTMTLAEGSSTERF